jgi:SAM-dependent methyltransferase
MTTACNVCATIFKAPIFESGAAKSLTTMNTLIDGKTTVYFCDTCQHAQTNALPDLETFYATEYAINLDSEDDDQLYDVVNGKQIYRSDHQAAVLMSKIDLTQHTKVLDYGCAKAPSLRKVCDKIAGIEPYLFDVTDKYVSFWQRFPNNAKWATHTPDPAWAGQMDVVLSFYALEHIPHLTTILNDIKALLRDGGYFYFLVPDTYQNAADFIVADHVNHFSHRSLWHLLSQNGFIDIEIDATAHASAYVVSARVNKSGAALTPAPTFANMQQQALDLGQFWTDISSRITAFEDTVASDVPLVIYGAGIYGNFIYSCLKSPQRLTYFLDQNTFLQGTTVHSVPVIHPDALPSGAAAVLVGLNPRNARRIISKIPSLNSAEHIFLFLQ